MAQQNKDTTSTLAVGWALMLLVLGFLAWVFWYYNKFLIMDTVRWIRWAELSLVRLVVDDGTPVATTATGQTISLGAFIDGAVAHTPTLSLSPDLISTISSITMPYYLVIFSGVLVVMALWTVFYGPGTRFRRRLEGLDQLIAAQSRAFPYIRPLVDFDPGKQPFRPPGAPVPATLPPFAEALAPEEWIAYHQIPTLTGREIDHAAAAQAFSKQLGRPWRGWTYLPAYRQVLLAAFCLKAARKRKEADDLLGDLACCWNKGSLKLTTKIVREARRVLKNRKLSEKTLAKCNLHAFEHTALLRALLTAREEGGVLAAATFIWLRGYDRALWYPLTNLGRNAYHMEAMGAMCHFKAEKMAQRPIVRPKIEGAVESLSDYMKTYRARPIPQLDYTGSRRRGIQKAMKKGAA